MRITSSDGTTIQGVLLCRTENIIRVVIKGGQDIADYFKMHGRWVSDLGEPVKIEFVSEAKDFQPPAANLIDLLLDGDDASNPDDYWLASRPLEPPN